MYPTLVKSVIVVAGAPKGVLNIGDVKNVYHVKFVESQLLQHLRDVKNMLETII
jgi:hypothetical protein